MNIKRKILNIFASIVMLFGMVPISVMGSAYAEEQPGAAPTSKKTVKSNGDGSYDITLQIEGKSSTETTATETDVVIVYDVSISMRTDNVYEPNDNGTWGYYPGAYSESTNDGNYVRLYRNKSTAGQLGSTGTYEGTVYVRTGSSSYDVYEGARYENTFRSNDASHTSRYAHAEPALKSLESALGAYSNVTLHRIIFGETARVVEKFNYGTYNDMATDWGAALQLANNTGNVDGHDKVVIFISDGNPRAVNNSSNNPDLNLAVYNNAVSAARQIVDGGASFYGIGAFGDVYNMQTLVTSSNSPANHYYSVNNGAQLQAALGEILDAIVKNLTVTDIKITDGITAATSTAVKGNAGAFRYSVPAAWGNDYGKAEFRDGAVYWNPGANKTLSNGEKASVTFTVWPSQAAMDCIAAIRNGGSCDNENNLAEYGLIKSGDVYELKTNTTATFTYRTRTEVEGAIVDSIESRPQTIPEDPYDAPLPEVRLKVMKTWADGMDPAQRDDIQKVALDLYVDRKTNPNPVEHYVFDKTKQQNNAWVGDENNNSYTYAVAPGVMKKLTDNEELRAIAKSVVTVNGVEYAVLESGHDYEFVESYELNQNGSNHYHITKRLYHPMIVNDGGIHDVVFNSDGTATIEKVGLTELSVENTLNGGILVSKVVVNNGKEDTTIADEYEITITLTNPTGKYRILTKNADGTTTKGDKIDYTNGTIKEKIKVNQQIMVTDVPTGTTFNVAETLPEGYTSNKVDYKLIKYDGTEDVSGSHEVQGNASSTATVTNYLESGNLVISKEVTATSGNLDNARKKSFSFTVDIYKNQNDTKPYKTESFELSHGKSYQISNIPLGFYYKITEAPKAGFNGGKETVKTGTIGGGNNEVKFKNDYAISTGLVGDDAKIIASKSFASGYENFWLSEDKFIFVMTGNGEVQESGEITKASDTAEFMVNITKEGTFEYRITEKTTSENGNSILRPGVLRLKDDEDIIVTIVTEDNNDGTLRLVSKTYSKESKKIFNTYEATGTLGEGETEGALKFKKVLEGRDWEDFDEYTFTIESTDGKLPTKTKKTVKKGQTEFDFGVIKYTAEDVGKTYNYVVRETFDSGVMKNVMAEQAGGISFDVTVKDNEDGTLSLEVSEYEHTFVNVYVPDSVSTDESDLTKDLFEITKIVEDESESFEGEEFVFAIESDDFETRNVKIKTKDEASARMEGAYVFTEAGTYKFIIKELAGKNDEMIYDGDEYEIEIVVVDEPTKGKLKIKSAKINGKNAKDSKLLFNNTYEPAPEPEPIDPCLLGGCGGDIILPPVTPDTGRFVETSEGDANVSDETNVVNYLIGVVALFTVSLMAAVFKKRRES